MLKLRRAVIKLTLLGVGTEAGGREGGEAGGGEGGDGGAGRGEEWSGAQRVLRRQRAMTQLYLDLWDEEAEAQLLARYDVFASRSCVDVKMRVRLFAGYLQY